MVYIRISSLKIWLVGEFSLLLQRKKDLLMSKKYQDIPVESPMMVEEPQSDYGVRSLDRDLTPEELYAVIVEDIKSIYAE